MLWNIQCNFLPLPKNKTTYSALQSSHHTDWATMLIIMLIKIQSDATVCRYLFTAKPLYMFQVSQHPSSGVHKTVTAAYGTGHNTGTATSLQRGLIRPRWWEVAVPVLWPHGYVHRNAMLIKIQPDATVCRYLFTAKSLYMFRVSQHPSSGVLKTNRSLRYWYRILPSNVARSGHVGAKYSVPVL